MTYPGRKLPYEVVFGDDAEPPPLSVSHILAGRIVLTGGQCLEGTYEHREEVSYNDEGDRWENPDLYAKLIHLNFSNIPFQYNPKEMASPGALMVWWQDIGRLKEYFREIAWLGPRRWHITRIEPPVIGTGGWDGPKPFGS